MISSCPSSCGGGPRGARATRSPTTWRTCCCSSARRHLPDPVPDLSLLPHHGRRSARADRSSVLRRRGAGGSGFCRRTGLAPRQCQGGHLRHLRGYAGVGLYIAAADAGRCGPRVLGFVQAGPFGISWLRPGPVVRAHGRAARPWRGVESRPQHHPAHRGFAPDETLRHRTGAGGPVHCLAHRRPAAGVPSLAFGGDGGGTHRHRGALSGRSAHKVRFRQLCP